MTAGAGGEGGNASRCGGVISVTGDAAGVATVFAGVGFVATLLLALAGIIDLPLTVIAGKDVAPAASALAGELTGSVTGLAAGVSAGIGTMAATGDADGALVSVAVTAASTFAALCSEYAFKPAAIPAPAAIKSAAIHTGRIALKEKLPPVS